MRSSRRLAAEAGFNLKLIWLLRGVRPDFPTIADFRRDNRRVQDGVPRVRGAVPHVSASGVIMGIGGAGSRCRETMLRWTGIIR